MSYTLQSVSFFDKQFRAVQKPEDLSELLKTELHLLQLLAIAPNYHTFHIRKRNGKSRLIEDPEPHLKQVQKQLNHYLQSVYYFQKSLAAYGFQIAIKNQNDPRNIISNAQRHRHDSFMLKADFQDFFHQISDEDVGRYFQLLLPDANESCTELITQLCCFNGRLPMGSPTSPVLSNMFTVRFDNDILTLAQKRQWTYTRFADDLVFSGSKPFSPQDFLEIQSIAAVHDLFFNDEKTEFLHHESEKIITGIRLTENGVNVPRDFFEETTQEIQKLKTIVEVQSRSGLPKTEWIENFKSQIKGQINFVKFVLGEFSEESQKLTQQYLGAIDNEQFGYSEPVSWINLAYLV